MYSADVMSEDDLAGFFGPAQITRESVGESGSALLSERLTQQSRLSSAFIVERLVDVSLDHRIRIRRRLAAAILLIL